MKNPGLIKANIFRIPEKVELAAISTAGHYILAAHLVVTLTKLDSSGNVEPGLAIKWSHTEDYKQWHLWLKQESFSNGAAIKPSDVVASIQRQTELKTGVHFPFAEIEKVYVDGEDSVVFHLKNSRTGFLYDLSKPEFGVLHESDVISKKGESKFSVSSGPYFLDRKDNNTYFLKRNLFYKSNVENEHDLILEGSIDELSLKNLLNGSIDFLATQQNLSLEAHQQIESNDSLLAAKPQISFSYWLSINPNSDYFQNLQNRAKFQVITKSFTSAELNGHIWEKADQLYHPIGDGRPTIEDLKSIWFTILANASKSTGIEKRKLKIVPLKISNSLIVDFLKYLNGFYQVEIVSYETEEQLIEILQCNKFDIKISSNDFSSNDLSGSLITTFNTSRPYIFLDSKSRINDLMHEAASSTDTKLKSNIFKTIGINLLEEGLIAPLAYQTVWFYHKKTLDISQWSKVFPEISFWKAIIND
ncbi:ABC transporter substrate-binding protein [Bdellovibrio reynosensis]|uniref:ABC transporter substrate-binding protein n=1 Tax=Bdellovibrio reynosensis TaxID=2835041 RepID=A0ABY4C999_9BACT|nr:ABC transporter substrate-binding protein [Bdellovibrio reynosensis]UOF01049.1 ABC transporter substrate-binding protein [Bdellovibrio reynosensis]